jgi:peptidoglycan/xylan/chitin deacetylase (PgdA/CDA1 family)
VRENEPPSGTRILMLHRVLDGAPSAFGLPDCYRMRGTAITVAELERVVEGAGPILALEDIEQALARGEDPPVGSVLTFDDGYREHLDVVAPLLAAGGVSATFYVATGLRGDGSAVAVVDAWYWLLDHAERGSASVPLSGGGTFDGRIDTAEGKAAWVGGRPKSALLAATPEDQRTMLDALAETCGAALPEELAVKLYLKPADWRSLARLGMRVGAHSVSHPRLTQIGDEELDREVGESVRAIAEICSPVAFAYPDGAFDERVLARVGAAGVSSAVTCEIGPVARSANTLALTRIWVSRAGGPRMPLHDRHGRH